MAAGRLSNISRAVFVCEDLSSIGTEDIDRSMCLPVDKFHYCCERGHSPAGVDGGLTASSLLCIEIRSCSEECRKHFHKSLLSNDPMPFSFIFNAKYDDNNKLAGFDDAMTALGFAVGSNESFDEDHESSEMETMKVNILLSSIIYLSDDGSRKILSISSR